jgi:hypothetical protein
LPQIVGGHHEMNSIEDALMTFADTERVDQEFPLDALPPAFVPVVEALMSFFEIDPVLPVMSVLGINSSALGAGLQVRSNKAATRGNLYQLVAAGSGTCKTLVQSIVQEPLNRIQNELTQKYNKEVRPKLQAEEKLLDLEIRELIKATKEHKSHDTQSELEQLMARDEELEDHGGLRIWTTDVTSQALGSLLADHNEQISVISAEGGLVLHKLLGINIADDQLLCAGFSGDSHAVDRISRDPITLQSPCINLFLAVQPDILYRAFASERLRLGGFLARCISVDSELEVQFEDSAKPIEINAAITEAWATHVRGLFDTFRMSSAPYVLPVESGVYEASREFYNRIVGLVRGGLSDVASFPVRWNEQAWRVALNLHAGQFGTESVEHVLSVKTFESAVRIVQFFAGEQMKILRKSRTEELDKDLSRVRRLITQNGAPITLRDMDRRHGFSELRIRNLVKRFPSVIELHEIKHPEGGRPSWIVRLAPNQNLQNLRNP